MDKKVFWRAVCCILGCFMLYIFFSFPSWHEPVMGDEATVGIWIKEFNNKAVYDYFIREGDKLFGMWHPPAYPYLASFVGKFTAINESTIRTIGVVSFLISVILIYAIAYSFFRKYGEKEPMAILSCLIYTLNPLAVKGSLLIDIDVIMNVAVLAFILALVRCRYRENSRKELFVCIALFTATLCIKLSTPVILMMAILTYQLMRRDWGRLLFTLKIAAAGVFSAFIIGSIYYRANNMDFFSILTVPLSVGNYIPLIKSPGKEGWLVLARNIWSPFMWCSPAFIILGIIGIWKSLKTHVEDNFFMSPVLFAFYGLLIFVIYMFVGGVTHSFPKYHYAITPVFSVLAAGVIIRNIKSDKSFIIKTAILVSAFVLYDIYFVKDPIYLVSYTLKEAVISGNGGSVLAVAMEWTARIALLLLTIPIALLFYMKRKIRGAFVSALFASMLAFNISMLLIQRAAPYNTVYCYGASGVKETSGFVMSNTSPDDIILAPSEILFLSDRNLRSYGMGNAIRSKDAFLNMLYEGRVNCIVYGITGNTAEQYKRIFCTEEIKSFLGKKYSRHDIGSYTVWLKIK